MTEKHYGGSSSFGLKDKNNKANSSKIGDLANSKNKNTGSEDNNNLTQEEISKLRKAGKIASEVVKYAKNIVKKDVSLRDIAEQIEYKILELGAKPAFPVNLSINDIAAHSTPSYNDTQKAHGLLKVDIGVHIDGYVADTAISIDLENSEENKKLINAAESALSKALEIVNSGISLGKIGETIENSIKSLGFLPIQNLSGHSIHRYDLHSGITIPNYDTQQQIKIAPGLYAIEPFSTNGFGLVRDGKPSGIYHLKKEGNVRDSLAREVMQFIVEEYNTLPFCSRWIHKKFGTRSLIALKRIEEAGLIYQYPQLIEKNSGKVAQAEHTILIKEKEKTITTL